MTTSPDPETGRARVISSAAPTSWQRKRYTAALSAVVLLLSLLAATLSVTPASAHPLSTSAVLLDIGSTKVTGTIQIPIDRLAIALDEPLTSETVVEPTKWSELRQYVQQHVSATGADETPWAVRVTGGSVENVDAVDHLVFTVTLIPSGTDVTDFTLNYDAVVEHLLSHQILVSARAGSTGSYTSIGLIDWSQTAVNVVAENFTTSPAAGFFSSLRLGFTHITEGADHLLFLLMLLLPAPLLARRGRWTRSDDLRRDTKHVVHVVTAFAIGHSITLALGAFGLVDVPTRLVESLIAVSVVVSGVHAIRPLVRGGEVWIAGSFGLMHGLAFAALLGDLDLGRDSLLADLLGFNIGIELTQLVVVALVMPSLVVLSRTASYIPVRLVLAGAGVLLALAWFAERTTLLSSNPLEPVGEALTDHPLAFVLTLAAVAVAAHVLSRRSSAVSKQRSPSATTADVRKSGTTADSYETQARTHAASHERT